MTVSESKTVTAHEIFNSNNIVMHYTNKDDWIVVEGTHEAIIERNLFFEVQDIADIGSAERID